MRKYDLGSQLPENLTSQEWLSLKQQVLDHNDFPKFQTDFFNEVNEYNQKRDKKLEDPQTQKEIDFLIKKYAISERIRHYVNPFYFISKYQKYYEVRKEIRSFKFEKKFWIFLIFFLSIVLNIFSFKK